jgi:hypothetical protein
MSAKSVASTARTDYRSALTSDALKSRVNGYLKRHPAETVSQCFSGLSSNGALKEYTIYSDDNVDYVKKDGTVGRSTCAKLFKPKVGKSAVSSQSSIPASEAPTAISV